MDLSPGRHGVETLSVDTEQHPGIHKGLIEVTEDATRSQREGETVVVRSDVTAKVDPVMVQRRINAVRQSQNVGD